MSLNEKLLIALIALNVLDAFLTVRILKDGGRELNPIMAKMMDRIGDVPALLLSKAVMVAIMAYILNSIPYQVMLALCGVYVGVVAWNIKTLRKINN